MFKKLKGLLSLFICISTLCTVMPIEIFAAEGDVASVAFGGSTTYYATIDEAWAAAVALDTAAENKATIKLLANCKAENTLTNTADYLVLDTNGKTLTTPDANNQTSFTCGICVDGGSLELIGNGTVTGVSQSNYHKAILLINGGKVTANGITIHNTGTNGSNPVRIAGGEFYLIDSHLITDDEYALYANAGKVYLYSGTLETGKTARMVTVNGSGAEIQICYSEKPLYFVMRRPVWRIIDNTSYFRLEDNLVMDLEYSDNSDGSDSKMIRNVTQIDDAANVERSYLKIQTYKPSYLFSTNYNASLLKKVKTDGVTTYSETEITAVHFVNLADYDLTDVKYSDYSAKGDGSVKAWMDGTELYIGGYRKIIAGRSLNCAFRDGKSINSITGLDLLDTSGTADMGYVFNNCGYNSSGFTLDLGDNFDTSNATTMVYMFGGCGYSSAKFSLNLRDEFDTSKVTDMSYMFIDCGRSSPTFTLDPGDRFDTSSVTTMYRMFERCGYSSTAFTTLDLSTFRVSADTNLSLFANDIPVTKFIFGRGWRNATVAMKYDKFAESSSDTPTEIVGATKNLRSYDWASNNRTVTFTDNVTYTITVLTEGGGWVRGESTVLDGESITLTAVPARNGYSLEGWYEGEEKVCDTEEFVIEDASDDKTYTAKFIQTTPYYSISARVKDSGGQVSGSEDVPEGGSVTLTATPDAGYTFDGWYDGDTKVCDTEEFTVSNVTENKTYTARFARIIVYYTVSAEVGESGGGTVSGGGKVEKGSNVTLTATPDDGYYFVGWYDGTTRVATTKEYTVKNVKADKTYTAKFSKSTIYYTISAEVGTDGGGTVSGGGKVKKGGSITLAATADDGYTFDGWYDGDTKVCDTAEFTVSNVTKDKTYTAKFTKNQVDPDPEPEEPDVPYLKWDGSTLTLVKKADASCRVGIVYVGGATFDADNISWDELVATGKEYANLNSPIGYAVYNNFTKRTPGTRGNYVAFVKYTKDDGTTTADYITYTVKDAVSFEVPALSYNTKTKSLKMKGNVSSTIGIAYVGDEEFNTSNITWNDFVKAGKKYSDINGDSGYAKVLNTLDYTKTFDNNGNYAAFIKYFDENLNKTIAKYYTFTVSDYDSQPTDAPFAVAEENKIILTANGLNVNKVTIVYIGTEDMYISNWNEFSAAAAKFSDINGKSLNQQYTNPKDGSAWEQDTDGWYAVYIRYLKDDKTYNSYYTVEVN